LRLQIKRQKHYIGNSLKEAYDKPSKVFAGLGGNIAVPGFSLITAWCGNARC